MANGSTTPDDSKKPENDTVPSLIQTIFPQQPTVVFFAALVVGLFLISTAFFRSFLAVNEMQSNLFLCVGVALVLVAFGGQATVTIGKIIMAGSAGVTLGFFLLMQYQSRNLFVQGTIKNFDYEAYKSLVMQAGVNSPIFVRIVPDQSALKQSHCDFIIFEHDLSVGRLIDVSLTGKTTGERVISVPVDEIKPLLGGPELVWVLREEGPDSILTLVDQVTKKPMAHEEIVGVPPSARTPTGPMLIGSAFAEERSDINVPLMLERLKAEDTPTRRGARDALSQAPLDDIPLIIKTLRAEFSNYQVKLGICVALAEMLRTDKNQAAAISAKLNEDDLNLLLDAAGDPDRTVRVYAAEFLFDLGDRRTTKLAIPRAAKTSDDNARYNWLLVSQDGWRKLSRADKDALADPLSKAKQQSGTRTLPLFDKLRM